LKSTETVRAGKRRTAEEPNFSNFGSLKSTETSALRGDDTADRDFSNFGSLKSTETSV